jgi:hypothetical protein
MIELRVAMLQHIFFTNTQLQSTELSYLWLLIRTYITYLMPHNKQQLQPTMKSANVTGFYHIIFRRFISFDSAQTLNISSAFVRSTSFNSYDFLVVSIRSNSTLNSTFIRSTNNTNSCCVNHSQLSVSSQVRISGFPSNFFFLIISFF